MGKKACIHQIDLSTSIQTVSKHAPCVEGRFLMIKVKLPLSPTQYELPPVMDLQLNRSLLVLNGPISWLLKIIVYP